MLREGTDAARARPLGLRPQERNKVAGDGFQLDIKRKQPIQNADTPNEEREVLA